MDCANSLGRRKRYRYTSGFQVAIARDKTMNIWVDADACPVVIKDILFRSAERTGLNLTLVANQALKIPPAHNIKMLQVPSSFDVADNEIVKRLVAGDLVITADIPLAAEVIAKGGQALNPRGELYSPDTIKAKLSMRDFMDTLRGSGMVTGGPPRLSHSDRKQFASRLDMLVSRYLQTQPVQAQRRTESS